jgi:hypothetical protein
MKQEAYILNTQKLTSSGGYSFVLYTGQVYRKTRMKLEFWVGSGKGKVTSTRERWNFDAIFLVMLISGQQILLLGKVKMQGSTMEP